MRGILPVPLISYVPGMVSLGCKSQTAKAAAAVA